MSRPSHLPPRCPHHGRSSSTRAVVSPSHSARHRRSPSQGSLSGEHPSWLDDLLTDPGTSSEGLSHRRSVSDSLAILEGAAAFQSPVSPVNEVNPISTAGSHKSPERTGGSGSGFEASCVYGPNSPRQKSTLTDSESSIVTALLENVPRNPLQYVSVDSNAVRDTHFGEGDIDAEKAARRHSGQRSRVRKIQHIAELERSVDIIQTMRAELAARLASQFQQSVALSIENKKLEQQLVLLGQEKMIKDGQYRSLRNEVEKLKVVYRRHRKSKSVSSYFEMGPIEECDRPGTSWQMLDMARLSLGGSQVTLKHEIGR